MNFLYDKPYMNKDFKTPTYIIEIITFLDTGFVAIGLCVFGIQKTLASHKPTQLNENIAAKMNRTEIQTTLFEGVCFAMMLIFEAEL